MRVDIVSLFPEQVSQVVEFGVVGRATDRDLLRVKGWNPRDYSHNRHRTADDRPYGGGPGMVMMAEPLKGAIEAARAENADARVIGFSPQGEPLNQAWVERLAAEPGMILVCGRYEGIDERLVASHIDLELSIGDYVLSGGELAAMVLIDAVARLLPGVLGDAESASQDSFAQDSFSGGLLDCPHYTRPEQWSGQRVPEVLMSGDHAKIARWRLKQALGRTWSRRPDLLDGLELGEEQKVLLQEFIAEQDQD